MTTEQFAAMIAALTIGTLVNKKVYDTFTDDQKVEYDSKAAAVATSFRAANPDGKEVEYAIDTINPTERGYAIVVAGNPKSPSKNKVFQFATAYVDNMAMKVGVHNADILQQVHAGSLDDNYLKTTFIVAIKGEKYLNRASGVEEVYKMTTLRNTNDTIILGDDAKGLLRESAKDALKNAMMANRKTTTRGRVVESANEVPVVEHAEEAL